MALIIEDGTVVANAQSYVTLAEANLFFKPYGDASSWNLADNVNKEAALISGAQYMQQKLRLLWKGSRVNAFQSLDWPRRGVDVPDFFDPFFRQVNVPLQFQDTVFIPENVVPEEVKDGQMQIAVLTISTEGVAGNTQTLQPFYGRKSKREKVGDLEIEYMTAEDGGNTRQTNTYWDAMKIVEPFLRPSAPQTGTVVRA